MYGMGLNPFMNQLHRKPYIDTIDFVSCEPLSVLGTLADLGMTRDKRGQYAFDWSQPDHGMYTFSEDEHNLIASLPNGKHLLNLFTLGGGLHTNKDKLEEELMTLYEAMLKVKRDTTKCKKAQSKADGDAKARIAADIEAKLRAEFEAKARIEADIEAKLRAEFEANARVKAKARIEADIEAKLRAEFEAKARVKVETRPRTAKAAAGGADATVKKRAIPKNVKASVWKKCFGAEKGQALCWCCGEEMLTQGGSWHCGHIVAESQGGGSHADNLRPICAGCNFGMSTQNMLEYMARHYPARCAAMRV